MTAFHWFVVLSSLSTLIFAWATYLLESFKKKNEKSEIDEEEEKLVELIGKVRIFVDSKLEQLDKKMEEARAIIKELNEQYVTMSALIVQLQNQSINKNVPDNSFGEVSENVLGRIDNMKNIQNVSPTVQQPTQTSKKKDEEEKSINNEEYLLYEKKEELENEKKEILIFDMYLSGIEPVEIAKRMKMGVGEVQLIIDLMKRQKSQ
ncbi:DUF6115 domain-containing protein [Fervidobacterium sp.]